jgi:hypothetical protein
VVSGPEGHLLGSATVAFRSLKALAERALAQVQDDRILHQALGAESNSLAIIVQHVGGNLLSRWTDFLSTDGEKPTRDRDQEFEGRPERGRSELLELWERGWSALFTTLDSLGPEDLVRTVYIRGEAHLVVEALHRSLTHTASHVGQIVFLAKHLESGRWTSLSIPRGRSKDAGPNT